MSDKLITLSGLSTFWNNIKSKFATAAQGAKADTALQKADITTGTANGSVSVDGSNVSVKGLASAAYKTAGSASGNVPVNGAALGTTANRPIVTNSNGQLIPHPGGALGTMAFEASDDYATKATTLAGYGITDAYTKSQSDTALTNHKTSGDHDGRYYTESEVDAKINALNTNMKALIWTYTVNAGSITVPTNAAYAFSGKAPSLEGYNAVGVLSVYHSDNDGRLAISKFYCEPDTGNYGAVIKNNTASQYTTNLYFVLLYVRDRALY